MENIKSIINIATEDELVRLLGKTSEEIAIKKIAEDITNSNLDALSKDDLIKTSATLINRLFTERFAEKTSMELDGFLKYLFTPGAEGLSNFNRLGEMNVQTAKIAADDLAVVLETERRSMLDKLKKDLNTVEKYDGLYRVGEDEYNDDKLKTLYTRYTEQIPILNAPTDKARQDRMKQDQAQNKKEIMNNFNEDVYNDYDLNDLKHKLQAELELRKISEQEGDFKAVKDGTKRINMLAYKIRNYSEKDDPIYGRNDPVDAKGNPIPKEELANKGIFLDKKEQLIDEATKGVGTSLMAAEHYRDRLAGKVVQLNDMVYDSDFSDKELSSNKIKEIQKDVDDINKSLVYTYCAVFDAKLYTDQLKDNSGKSIDKATNTEYLKLVEAYEAYSELFLDTFDELNQAGLLKGFPISKEFIGRDLLSDIDEAKAEAEAYRETYAEKTRKDLKDVPIDYKYVTKLQKAESFLGRSEGKIIKNTNVQNEAVVDEKLEDYKDQLQLGDVLTAETKPLVEQLDKLKAIKATAEKNGDAKKVSDCDFKIKTIKSKLQQIAKGKSVEHQKEKEQIGLGVPTKDTAVNPEYEELKNLNKKIEVPVETKKQVEIPDVKNTDELHPDYSDLYMDIDDALNKTSSLDKDLMIVSLRYGALHDDYSDIFGDEDPTAAKPEGEIEENNTQEEVQPEKEVKEEVKFPERDKMKKELIKELSGRVKQFEDKKILSSIIKIFTNAANEYEKINKEVSSKIKFEDIQQAIVYYKENRQKLRTASVEDISIYEFIRLAASSTLAGLEQVMLKYKELIRFYTHEDNIRIPGMKEVVLPIKEYQNDLEKNPIGVIPELKKSVKESIIELMNISTIPSFKRGQLMSLLDELEKSLNSVDMTQVEKSIPTSDKKLKDKFDYTKKEEGSSKGTKKEKIISDDPLSKAAAELETYYKQAASVSKEVGAELGKFIKDDNTFTTVAFVNNVFGTKSLVKESDDGERTWGGIRSNGNSNVNNVVGGVDKLGYYRAIRLYPQFLGEVTKMMEKTANEINNTPIKGSAEEGDALYGYSKTIDHGKIESVPGLYKVNTPMYNRKVKKAPLK